MKSLPWILLGVLLTAGASIGSTMGSPAIFTPASLHWIPGTGPTKGTWAAVMVGDPTKPGNSIIRVKMPDGYVNQPHYHSHPEYVTIIQGTVLFGTGDTVDTAKATTLSTGSFIMVPAGVHHWSVVKGETIVQVGGQGPLINIPIKKSGM
jgi:quercetin dioxygenase-like cupin family protein